MRRYGFAMVIGLLAAGCGCAPKQAASAPDGAAPPPEAMSPTPPAPTGDMNGMLRVTWRLQSQEDVYGFNVYRGETDEGPWTQANKAPVPGHDTTSTPHEYEFWDMGIEVGRTYHYYVEEITFSGTTNKITPVLSSFAKTRDHYLAKGLTPPP